MKPGSATITRRCCKPRSRCRRSCSRQRQRKSRRGNPAPSRSAVSACSTSSRSCPEPFATPPTPKMRGRDCILMAAGLQSQVNDCNGRLDGGLRGRSARAFLASGGQGNDFPAPSKLALRTTHHPRTWHGLIACGAGACWRRRQSISAVSATLPPGLVKGVQGRHAPAGG